MQNPAHQDAVPASAIGASDWIRYHASHRPDSVAISSVSNGRSFTYRQFSERIDALAHWLTTACGVKSGKRVLHLSKTRIEAFEVQFACMRLGAIYVPVNWRLNIAELLVIAADAEPCVTVYEPAFENAARAIEKQQHCTLLVFAEDGVEDSPYEQALARKLQPFESIGPLDWETTWILLYTSGTTGVPKGAMLSYRMMSFNALNFIPTVNLSSSTTFLCCTPIFHTAGLNCYANPVFYCGGHVIVMSDFAPQKTLELFSSKAVGITHFFAVPTMYQSISELKNFAQASFPTLINAGCGGAPATESLVSRWLDKGIPIQPAYGMTEIGPAIAISNTAHVQNKRLSVGHFAMNGEMRVVDEKNQPVHPGSVGELQVRGAILMSGYWKKPKQTRESYTDDGWFRTGDAVRQDTEGCLYIVDRYKDMYISGGENVYPTEVENAIAKHPAVLRTAVIGVKDAKWGEVGEAYVVLKQGSDVTHEKLNEHLAALLARYKLPKMYHFVDELPQTGSGKVKRAELRAMRAASQKIFEESRQ